MKAADPQFVGRRSARALALEILFECRRKQGYVGELLDKHLRRADLSPADRRLCTAFAYGVLRRRGTLDALLRPLVSRSMDNVEAWLLDVLRLGAFQLAFLSHVPPHAAIFETVELTQALQRTRAKGFINGVLRSLLRCLSDEDANGPAANALPLEARRYRRLTQRLLPDPAEQPAAYIADAFALPAWLVERWLRRFSWEECLRLGFWFAAPAPMVLRCNSLKVDRDQYVQTLAAAGIEAKAGTQPQAICLAEPMPVRDLPGWDAGACVVQDGASMEVISVLDPQPGATVLDMCAAPGGKTTHIAERMRNQGRIVASDIDQARLQSLPASCARLGISIVMLQKPPVAGKFDAVLVDVPCSNTGVLGRRPEVRWRLKPDDLHRLVQQQTQLLREACDHVRPGGTVVYSTCSMEPEENRQVVESVLASRSDFVLAADKLQIPGQPADGGYWAKLRPGS